jgi:hypothetical protein
MVWIGIAFAFDHRPDPAEPEAIAKQICGDLEDIALGIVDRVELRAAGKRRLKNAMTADRYRAESATIAPSSNA